MHIPESLSYDDILLIPSYSEILPKDVNTKTVLAGSLSLNIPILSAAMDTVTEDKMAISIALQGGAGVIHRNLNPKNQAEQVSNVKRYLNWIIDSPVTVEEDKTIGDVRSIMKKRGVTGLPVINSEGLLRGIITSRDLRFHKDDKAMLRDVMTIDLIVESGNPSPKSAREKFNKYKIEKLPVVDSSNKLLGLITVKDMEKKEENPNAALDSVGRLIVGAAISPQDYEIRLPLLINAKCDFVVMDTAHGDTKSVAEAINTIKKQFDILVIGGNVATAAGVRHLLEAGADAIKVGIGPGSICTTRIVAGIGVPQFTAVLDCAEEAAKTGIPVIADGGIKFSGDIVKAIGAGASSVMIGNLLAGLKEAPGAEIIFDGRIYKEYRGMGSIGAIEAGSGDRYQMSKDESPSPEGIEGRVPYKGELKDYLYQLIAGLKKGMGYTGCKNIDSLKNYKKFIKISNAGLKESHAHDIFITREAPNYSRQ